MVKTTLIQGDMELLLDYDDAVQLMERLNDAMINKEMEQGDTFSIILHCDK